MYAIVDLQDNFIILDVIKIIKLSLMKEIFNGKNKCTKYRSWVSNY